MGRDYAPLARRMLAMAAVAAVLAGIGGWMWHQPFMAYPRAVAELSRMPVPQALPVPVDGVEARRIADTWGGPRGGGRRHQGVDIFAARGTAVTSTTRGLVLAVRDAGLGGRQVWILGPGAERHYYAHLGAWDRDLRVGGLVRAGSRLGVVGDTGNARGTPPHLHYGIYTAAGAVDPRPRLQAGALTAAARAPRPSPRAPRRRARGGTGCRRR